MHELLDALTQSLNSHGFIASLLGGGAVVTLFVYARQILGFVLNGLLAVFSFRLHSRFNCTYCTPEMMQKMMILIETQGKTLWAKNIEITNSDSTVSVERPLLHGVSLHWLYGKLVFLSKDFSDSGMQVVTFIEIRVISLTKKRFMQKFTQGLKEISVRPSEGIILVDAPVLPPVERTKRKMSTIYSPDGVGQKLLDDARSFLANRELYEKCAIPYKRNYLLYGAPGTGKTSAAFALASELDFNICLIDIATANIMMVERSMVDKKNTIFLFEDVDAAFSSPSTKRDDSDDEPQEQAKSEITLAQLLNITDGVRTQSGAICLFTTNHIEALDDALLRDGRMDMKLEFKMLDGKTTSKMLKDLTNLEIDCSMIEKPISPASVQELALKYRMGGMTVEEVKKRLLDLQNES